MAMPRRSYRQAVDDTQLSSKPAASFEDELKKKAMTLGRKPRRKVQRIEEPADAPPPPPPPARLHSRRGSQNSLQINDCTPVKSESNQNTEQPSPLYTRPHKTSRSYSKERNTAPATSSTNGTDVQQVKLKSSKPPAKTPQNSQKPASAGTGGVASMRALLQAKLAGEQVSTSEDPPPGSPHLPPPRDRDRTERTVRSEATAPVQNELQSAFASRHNAYAEEQNKTQQERWEHQSKSTKRPPFQNNRSPPRVPPAAGRGQFTHSSFSNSSQRDAQEHDNRDQSSLLENRASPINESSSVESLCSRGSPRPPPVAPPPLPPKMFDTEDEEPAVPQKKPMRSKSFKKNVVKKRVMEEVKKEQIRPNQIPVQAPRDQSDTNSKLWHELSSLQLSGQVDLLTMISKGAHLFPMCVKVCDGFSSSTCRESFARYDKLYLHFVKNAKVGLAKDECHEQESEYMIPLSSSLEFGVLYEGDGADVSQFISTAADVMKLKPLPVVIRATKSFNGGSPEKSVEADELLFPKRVTKASILTKAKILEVQTLDQQIKHLSSTCEGDFSIHPVHIKMNLSTLSELSLPLPQRVYLLPNDVFQEHLPDTMTQEPVLLESIGGETSVICTIKDDDSDEQHVFDVSKNLNIQVQAEPIADEQEKRQLQETTSRLYNTLNPSHLKHVTEKQSTREYDLQCLLYQELIEGKEMDGIHYQLPSSLSTAPHTDPRPLPLEPLPAAPHMSSRPLPLEPLPAALHTDPRPLPLEPLPAALHMSSRPLPSEPSPALAESSEIISMASSEEDGSVQGVDPENDYEDVATALGELPAEDVHQLEKSVKKKTSLNSKLFSKLKTKFWKHEDTTDYEDMEVEKSSPTETDAPHGGAGREPEENYEPINLEESVDGDYSSTRQNTSVQLPSLKSASGSSAEPESNYAQMNSKIATIMSELHALKMQVHKLSTTVEKLASSGFSGDSSLTPPSMVGTQEDRDVVVKNKDFLRTLTSKQILQLLDTMGLSNYRSGFQQRSVTGEQLAEIDEKTLEEIFSIKSSFHRKKLMRVLSGALHATVFLSRNS